MRLGVGTSGYSYAAWKGPFYPKDLPASGMLRYYAERLGAVEINNTFYRLPKRSVLEGWTEQVPAEFRFVLKASRRITHLKRLKDVGDETRYLLETSGALGERLGAILYQLPPNLKCDLERLDAFLALLPADARAAFEFRHASWHDAPVFERLRARDFPVVAAQEWREAFVFFKHEDEGAGPRLAAQFLELAGGGAERPPAGGKSTAQQGASSQDPR